MTLRGMSGDQLALAATAIAVSLSRQFKGEDLNVLSNLVSTVGSVLGLIAAGEGVDTTEQQSQGQGGEQAGG